MTDQIVETNSTSTQAVVAPVNTVSPVTTAAPTVQPAATKTTLYLKVFGIPVAAFVLLYLIFNVVSSTFSNKGTIKIEQVDNLTTVASDKK